MNNSQHILDQLFSQQAPLTPLTPRPAMERLSWITVQNQRDSARKNVTNNQNDEDEMIQEERKSKMRRSGLIQSQVFQVGPAEQCQEAADTISTRVTGPYKNFDNSNLNDKSFHRTQPPFSFISTPSESKASPFFMFEPTASQPQPRPSQSSQLKSSYQWNPTSYLSNPTDLKQCFTNHSDPERFHAPDDTSSVFSQITNQYDLNHNQPHPMSQPIAAKQYSTTYQYKPEDTQHNQPHPVSQPIATKQYSTPYQYKPEDTQHNQPQYRSHLHPKPQPSEIQGKSFPTTFKFKSSKQKDPLFVSKQPIEKETQVICQVGSSFSSQDPSVLEYKDSLHSLKHSSVAQIGTVSRRFDPQAINLDSAQVPAAAGLRTVSPPSFVPPSDIRAVKVLPLNKISQPAPRKHPFPAPSAQNRNHTKPVPIQSGSDISFPTPQAQNSTNQNMKAPRIAPPKTYTSRPMIAPPHPPQSPSPSLSPLHPVSSLPPQYQIIFKEFSHFNQVQSEVLPDILNTDQPIVVASPTGSGKTVLFELAIVRLLDKMQSSVIDFKMVYIAPIKALCSERYRDWVGKFTPLGVKVVEVTGDMEGQDVEEIRSNNLIITTPEKWDAVSRWLSLTDPQLISSLRLLMIDEVHLLNDKDRGHVLEAVVCRLKTLGCPARYVGVSATFPNVEDIAFWLGGSECVFFKFGEEVRPVKLRRVVMGFYRYEGQNEFMFEMNLSYKLEKILQDYGESLPTLVFCNSRKSTMNTCTVLAKQLRNRTMGEKRNQLMSLASRLGDCKLKLLVIEHGVGYHHAGLVMEDRRLVEEIFSAGLLAVLTCTSTLAMGVNLPAHLVVIKSTQQMVAGAWREYSESHVLQMAGRAGRPQFCDTATVVIMTEQGRKKFYDSLIEGNTMVESNLHSHLFEHLNAEIILGTIKSVGQATDWIKSTYLYLRVRRNPTFYDKSQDMSMDQLEESMYEMCLEALQSMAELGLITMMEDETVWGTSLGKLMSRFYLAFSTMKQLTSINGMDSMVEMLGLICKSRELAEAVLRMNERKTLNSLNRNKEKNTIRFPLEGKIKTKEMKVNVLIQASLGCMHIPDAGLNMETPRFVKLANRIATCLVELVMKDEDKSKNLTLVKNSVCLLKSLNCGVWDDSKFVVKQMDKVGTVLSTALVKAGFTNFSKLSLANPRMIEFAAKKAPPFGNIVRDFAMRMPQYMIEVKQVDAKQNSVQVDVMVTMVNREVVGRRDEVEHGQHRWVVLVGNGNNRVLATFRGCDTLLLSGHSVFQRSLRLNRDRWEDRLEVILISLTISGVDASCVLHLRLPGMVQPPAFPSRPPSLSQYRRACRHSCVDKQACAHPCCKDGVTHRNQAAGFMENIHLIRSAFKDKFNTSLVEMRTKQDMDREEWKGKQPED